MAILRDIISRRYSDGGVIVMAASNETLMIAFNRMRNAILAIASDSNT